MGHLLPGKGFLQGVFLEKKTKTEKVSSEPLDMTSPQVFRRIGKQLPQMMSLQLSQCSPALFAASDLQLAVPGTFQKNVLFCLDLSSRHFRHVRGAEGGRADTVVRVVDARHRFQATATEAHRPRVRRRRLHVPPERHAPSITVITTMQEP
jgi:hypothetical protein